MIPCPYCGRKSDDTAKNCWECGSELAPEVPLQDSSDLTISLQTRTLVRSGLGSIFICTAVYYSTLQIFFDIQEILHGGPIGKPGIYAVGILFIPFAILLGIGAFAFTVGVFHRRSPEGWREIVVTGLTLLVIATLFARPALGFWLPAFLLGKATGSSTMGYFGAAIQVVLGCWSLGWFDRWISEFWHLL